MKLKKDFKLRKVGEFGIAIPIGEKNSMNGNIILNKTGCFIWELIEQEYTKKQILEQLTQKYNVEIKQAEEDLNYFLSICFENKLIIEQERDKNE